MFSKIKSSIILLSTLLFVSNGYAQKMAECDTASCQQYFSQYKKAAKRGHPQASATLGQMYYHGYGVDKNEKMALKYLKKASINSKESLRISGLNGLVRHPLYLSILLIF